jgi:hypothetical protein
VAPIVSKTFMFERPGRDSSSSMNTEGGLAGRSNKGGQKTKTNGTEKWPVAVSPSGEFDFKCSVHSSTAALNTETICWVVVPFLGSLRLHSGSCGARVVNNKKHALSY